MTDSLRASILTAPLAAIDRRELLQAWCSALGLVQHGAPAARVLEESPSRERRHEGNAPATVSASRRQLRSALPLLRLVAARRDPSADGGVEAGRRSRTYLARAIERTFAGPQRPARATFSIGSERARVHVVMQNRGGRLRLVALCAPVHRAVVARALVRACRALAARGVTATIESRAVACC
ncbi:MAG TPA: hypothetical protein VGF86_14665 [Candidatus Tumulicola sp.]